MLERNELTSTLSRLKDQLRDIERSLRQPLTREHLADVLNKVHEYRDLAAEAEAKIRLLDSG